MRLAPAEASVPRSRVGLVSTDIAAVLCASRLKPLEGATRARTLRQAIPRGHIEPWCLLHEDLTCLAQGLAMAEATEQVAQEREPSSALYRMLVGALRTLASQPGPLVVAAFYWKLLSLDGAGPIIDCCASCGSSPPATPLVAFDIAEGGALCRDCRRGHPLSPAALELLSWILGGQLTRALQMPASATTGEVASLATVSLERHLERNLRALHILERS